MLRRWQRLLLFAGVGVTCFLVQYGALSALSLAGVIRPAADALGFMISAQLNFALSARLTWRDRPGAAARTRWARLVSYNVTALVSLAVNTAAFTLTYHRLGNLAAAALGVVCGMCVTYTVCDLLIFRDLSRGAPVRARLGGDGVALLGQPGLTLGVADAGSAPLRAAPLDVLVEPAVAGHPQAAALNGLPEAATLDGLALGGLAEAATLDGLALDGLAEAATLDGLALGGLAEAATLDGLALGGLAEAAALDGLALDGLAEAATLDGPTEAAALDGLALDGLPGTGLAGLLKEAVPRGGLPETTPSDGLSDTQPLNGLVEALGVAVANGNSRDGMTIVMPAYCEEDNLPATVADFLRVPASLGVPHCVVVVNDGSEDWTGEIADSLAADNPGRVIVVHHGENRGYGAALSTGIATALARTSHRWLFLTDSDGQFRATQLPEFLDAARTERADVVVGFRSRRADPLHRRVNAFLWTTASRLLLPVGIRDVDCSYKLIDRRSLDGVELRCGAATISPELIANLRLKDARIIERPVDHFPRQYGEQTGAKLSVIIRSLIGLVGLSARITARRAPGHALRRLVRPKDAALTAIMAAAVTTSVASYLYFLHRHATLAYPDAISHLLIARRVIDSPTPGAAQLGAVWLPLPHLLAVPLIWVNAWYYSGFAGSVVSMAAYVLTVRYAYLIAKGLTGNTGAGLTAAVAFGANPNVLYLQTTPMTELLLIACIAASVYYLLRWCQTARYIDLAATGAAALLASLTRYEGWVMCLVLPGIVAYVAWRLPSHDPGLPRLRQGRGLARWGWWSRLQSAEANVIFYSSLGMSGILGWVLWNAVIFHDALYFQTGPFAKPSLWVSHADKAIGHMGTAALTYLYAMADNAGPVALALGAAGVVWYLARTRLRPETIAPVSLLSFIPFYVYALYSGQRPLHVTQLNGSLYNVRFGLLMVLPTAIFIGYLATAIPARLPGWLRGAGYAGLVLAALACAGLVLRGGITTLTEALDFRATASEQANTVAANWLRSHYTGGKVLMESFGNETVTFGSRLPLDQVVYEGSFLQWGPALADPRAHGIRWIYMRSTAGNTDQVFQRLHGSVQLNGYRLVYRDPNRLIYELKPPAGPVRGPLPLLSGPDLWLPHYNGHHIRLQLRDGHRHRARRHHVSYTPLSLPR